MKYPPFLTPDEDDEAPAATAEIVQFPRDVTLRAKLRTAERQVERLEQQLADNDIRSLDREEQVRAVFADAGLKFWRPSLKEAQAAVAMLDADDSLTFRGQMYHAHRSFHGAN